MGVRRGQLKNCDVNRLEGNDTEMGRWMCNLKAEDRIIVVELRKRLQLSTMKECLRNRRLWWCVHRDRTEESSWPKKYRHIEVGSSLARGQHTKTWIGIIRNLGERKVIQKLTKDKNALKSFIKTCLNPCIHRKHKINWIWRRR